MRGRRGRLMMGAARTVNNPVPLAFPNKLDAKSVSDALHSRTRLSQSISTPNSSLIVHFTVLAVYTHSKLVFGLFAFITIRIKDQHGILLHQITFGASISPSSHFFLFRAHFSG